MAREPTISIPCKNKDIFATIATIIATTVYHIFQAVFVIPVVLQFKSLTEELAQGTPSSSSGRDEVCDDSMLSLALVYSYLDIANLSIGMFSDVLLYIGSLLRFRTFKKLCSCIFVIFVLLREIAHVVDICIHTMRCDKSTWSYEFVSRALAQYLIYGVWVVIEYLHWLTKGCLFVPKRHHMEPPESETDLYVGNDISESESAAGDALTSKASSKGNTVGETRSNKSTGPQGERKH